MWEWLKLILSEWLAQFLQLVTRSIKILMTHDLINMWGLNSWLARNSPAKLLFWWSHSFFFLQPSQLACLPAHAHLHRDGQDVPWAMPWVQGWVWTTASFLEIWKVNHRHINFRSQKIKLMSTSPNLSVKTNICMVSDHWTNFSSGRLSLGRLDISQQALNACWHCGEEQILVWMMLTWK